MVNCGGLLLLLQLRIDKRRVQRDFASPISQVRSSSPQELDIFSPLLHGHG